MTELEAIKTWIKEEIPDAEFVGERIVERIIQVIFRSDLLEIEKDLFPRIDMSTEIPQTKYKYVTTREPTKTLEEDFIFKFKVFR